jgi:hypothetical protein
LSNDAGLKLVSGWKQRGFGSSPVTEENQNEDTKELSERFSEHMSSLAPPELWLSLYNFVLWDMVVDSWTVLFVWLVFRIGGASFRIEVFGVLIM